MEPTLFNYKAFVTEVYDGDTITVEIDLGLSTFIKDEKIRLYRINAPEVTGKTKQAGIEARDFLRSKVLKKEIYIKTFKDKKEKYGRYLAEVYIKDENGVFININDLLVKNKFAEYKEY